MLTYPTSLRSGVRYGSSTQDLDIYSRYGSGEQGLVLVIPNRLFKTIGWILCQIVENLFGSMNESRPTSAGDTLKRTAENLQ